MQLEKNDNSVSNLIKLNKNGKLYQIKSKTSLQRALI